MSDTRGGAQRRPNNRGGATAGGGGRRVNTNGGATFKTDTDISRAGAKAGERELQPWVPDASSDAGAGGLGGLDDETFGSVGGGGAGGLALGTGKGSGGHAGGWDQFATNAKLFGQPKTTPYSEDLYTTRLNRSSHNFREREREAERLAREIEQGVSDNPHVREERGQALIGAGDEEERFSGVVRGTAEVNTIKVVPGRGKGAYVPPGARAGDAAGEKDIKKKATPPAAAVPAIALQAPSNAGTPVKLPVTTANTTTPSAEKPTNTTGSPLTNTPLTTSASPAAAPAPAPSARTDITHSLRRFADAERSKIAAVKADISKTERERRLADLVAFGREFKVPPKWSGAPGGDGKDGGKEKDKAPPAAAVNGTGSNTTTKPAGSLAAGKPSSSSSRIAMRIPEIPPFKGSNNSARTAQGSVATAGPAAPPAAKPTAEAGGEKQGQVPVPVTADRSVPLVGASSPVGNGQGLPLEPQGDDKEKKDKETGAVTVSGPGAKNLGGQTTGGAGRLNPAASAFTFKPNPAASAFRPLGNPPPVVNGARNGPNVAGGVSPNAIKVRLARAQFHVECTLIDFGWDLKKGPLPGSSVLPTGTPVPGTSSNVSPAHAQVPLAPPHQLQQHQQQHQQMTNPFFLLPLKRTPGVNIRDEFNPIRARRAASAPIQRPEDVPIVWQYSGRRVLSAIHHGPHGPPLMMMHHQQQMQHPTGMYNLHMNGIVGNPALAMHGVGGGGGPPSVSAVTPSAGGGGGPNGLSPRMPVQGLEDERFSPSPQLGIGPGGPGGFNRMPHQAMQPMGQPGMYFINGPMMQGMPYNPQMMPGNGGPPVRPGSGMYYQPQQQQPGQAMSSHPASPMPPPMVPQIMSPHPT
ncbi:hypothetical protein QFC24_000150 [Naganishia onofrii]|uniref:Uncharacterized protein n=1 Tax=Naganishia onofrii TaxID=1851511 RepID=A0ACC2XW58_9TREE|nr:hypothetical protein QFC24_000150 [Naganishia onofrii]